MSYYKHEKVIRFRIDENTPKKLGFDDIENLIDNFDDYMEKQCLELSCFEKEDGKRRITNKPPYFKAEPCYREQYIDLILFKDEGDGEYGYVSMLSKKEFNVFSEMFKRIGLDVKPEELRKVDYCFYNCSEPPDYFDVEETDWTTLI